MSRHRTTKPTHQTKENQMITITLNDEEFAVLKRSMTCLVVLHALADKPHSERGPMFALCCKLVDLDAARLAAGSLQEDVL